MIIAFLIIALLFTAYCWFRKDDGDIFAFGGLFITVMLAVVLITIPLARYDANAKLAEMEAIRALAGGNGIDSAAYRLKVADYNAWLASQKYNRAHTFWLWSPATIDKAEPIR